MPPQNSYPPRSSGGRDYAPMYGGYGDIPSNYSNESRNYTDSQLGVGGGGGVPQLSSPPPAPPPNNNCRPSPSSQSQQQQPPPPPPLQQYSTPRMPRHATVLKDRGSAENSVGSDPSGGNDNMGYGYGGRSGSKNSPSSLSKGNLRSGGSNGKNLNKLSGKGSSSKSQLKEFRSPEGRHTPTRDHNLEGQVLFSTPTQRRREVASNPTIPYSEPRISRTGGGGTHRTHQNLSPNYKTGGGYYGKNQMSKHQSKLPHGLTVQELKEMTRARLAAEAEITGPEGSSDQSVHSAGTQGSSKGSDQFSSGRASALAHSNESVTRNLVQSNENIRRDYSNQGGMGSQPFAAHGQPPPQMSQQPQPQNPPHYNYPRLTSPVFEPMPPSGPQFNGTQTIPRQTSPAFALSSSQTRSQGEAWETASATSSTLASDYHESAFHPANNSGAPVMPFSSPMSDSNAMRFNRARCFSAGANAGLPPSSYELHQANYYDGVPIAGAGNRQRCATVSPPGMSRLHEDRPYLFSGEDKERLAIPPLSEPRLRLHSTGGLNTHGTALRAFNSSVSPPPNSGSGSAFVPIGKTNEGFLPQSPPPLTVDRTKFGVGDRTISTGSAASGHGDLPSSMAEAVLESITSTSGAPIGGRIIGSSPFRSTEQDMLGNSPFRNGLSESSETNSSTFRMDSLLPDGSGSTSLFSSAESRSLFPSENSGERMVLGTHSWGGAEDDMASPSLSGISHDFSNLLNLSGNPSGNNLPPLRGRAATEPVWFGGNDPLLVSRIDPEHNGEVKPPPRVSSLVDTNAPNNINMHGQQGFNFEGGFEGFK